MLNLITVLKGRRAFPIVFLPLIILMSTGCSDKPDKSAMTDSIVRHFMARNYDVMNIEIREIKPFPIAKREYMAPEKYTIDISLIILQKVSSPGEADNKPLTFTNATVTVSKMERHGEWSIDKISGIPVI